MLSSTMHVRGVLTPTNTARITPDIKSRIRTEFREHNIHWVMNSSLGEDGIIELDSHLDTHEVRHSAMYFINRLRDLIIAEDIIDLKLEGNLTIVGYKWETNEPVILQVLVRNGNVAFQDGHVQWERESVIR